MIDDDPHAELEISAADISSLRIQIPPLAKQKLIVGNFHGQLNSELDRKRAAFAFALKTAPSVEAARKALNTAERKAGSTLICRYLTDEGVPLPRTKPGKKPKWEDGQFNDLTSAADKLMPAVVRHYRDRAHHERRKFEPALRHGEAGSLENLCVREVTDAIALSRWINGHAPAIEHQDRPDLLKRGLEETIALLSKLTIRIPKAISDMPIP